MNDLETRLARVSGRLQAQRDLVRAQLETRPELLALADECRRRFDARLTYVRIADWQTGNRAAYETGGVPLSPPPPNALMRQRRNTVKQLRINPMQIDTREG